MYYTFTLKDCTSYTECSKKWNPDFNFAITSVNVHRLYTDFNHFYCYNKKCMTNKSKVTPATSPLFCNLYLAQHTLLLMLMLHFRMCNILKFIQNGLVVIPYLLTYLFTAMLCDDAIMSYCVYAYCFLFNGIKTIKTENIICINTI